MKSGLETFSLEKSTRNCNSGEAFGEIGGERRGRVSQRKLGFGGAFESWPSEAPGALSGSERCPFGNRRKRPTSPEGPCEKPRGKTAVSGVPRRFGALLRRRVPPDTGATDGLLTGCGLE